MTSLDCGDSSGFALEQTVYSFGAAIFVAVHDWTFRSKLLSLANGIITEHRLTSVKRLKRIAMRPGFAMSR
jgi:hypothetical protein